MLLTQTERTSERSLICPVCGRESGSPSGHIKHVRMCKKTPPREELERLCEDRWSLKDMQIKYGASRVTVTRWLRDYGLKTFFQQNKPRAEDQRKIFPGYAPKRGMKWLQCALPPDPDRPGLVVPVCNAYAECSWRAMCGLPVLCEAPDEGQMDMLKRRNYDLLQDLTELWIEHPEYWTE